LEQQFGARFSTAISSTGIEQRLLTAGNGARGIVFGSRGPGEVGHVFNVVNQNGVIRFLDGQTGRPAVLNGYRQLFFKDKQMMLSLEDANQLADNEIFKIQQSSGISIKIVNVRDTKNGWVFFINLKNTLKQAQFRQL
jgi:Papain fold toxin 1, glutamine deamidase